MIDLEREIYTPAQLGELLGDVTERRVLDWCRENDWPHLRFGRAYRFTRDQVRAILSAHMVQPSAPPAAVSIAGQTKRSAARSA